VNQLPISESITFLLTAAITWFVSGKAQKQSIEIANAQAVLAMWKATADEQKLQIDELRKDMASQRDEIIRLHQKCDNMQDHITKIESENELLRKEVARNKKAIQTQ
jgi:predicted RNase H-like nuclease (RuvC/YqgF family)